MAKVKIKTDSLGNVLPVGISCREPTFRAILHADDRTYTATRPTKAEAEVVLQELRDLHPDYYYNYVATIPRHYTIQVRAYDRFGNKLNLRTTAPTLEAAKEKVSWYKKRYDTEDRRTIKFKGKNHG